MQHSFLKTTTTNQQTPKNHYIMKIKLLSILMAITLALAFTSCDSKKSRSHDDSSDSSKSEKVDKEDVEDEVEYEVKEIHPTGDIDKDAEALTQNVIAFYKKINTQEDALNIQKEFTEIQKEFQEFYKKKGQDKDFNTAYFKMMQDPKYAKDIKEGQQKIMKFVNEALKSVENK
jgi:primosomal protein N''